MSDATGALLLDTCALIWLVNGDPLDRMAMEAIEQAALSDGLFVSPVAAWEIGLLSRPHSSRAVLFLPDPKAWFAQAMTSVGLRPAPLTPDIDIDASHLPGDLHGDPADRMIIATARHRALPVVTRDKKIIAYAGTGHLTVLPC